MNTRGKLRVRIGLWTRRVVCIAALSVASIASTGAAQTNVGFNFPGRTPQDAAGDRGASTYLFVHQYPMPAAGFVSGVTFLNDREDAPNPELVRDRNASRLCGES
jgi:hypothetical protein